MHRVEQANQFELCLFGHVGPVLDREAAVLEGVHDADWRRGLAVGAVRLLFFDVVS